MPKRKKARRSKKTKKFSILKNPLFNKIIALIIISIGLFVLIGFPNPNPNSKNPIKISESLYKNKATENLPVRILLPKESIDLTVTPAKIVYGYWELSENSASYGEGSGIPGQKGNVVIFAHAKAGLFYNLKDVKVNDSVYVFTENDWFRYKVNKITAVYPNQTEIIQPTKTEVLTLYTCTGFSDEKRLIIQAIPEK